MINNEQLIPDVDPNFHPCGHFNLVRDIIERGIFFSVFVSGESGNGKTEMITQACAKVQRAMYRVSITTETDEDDLLGGFRLIDGETVFDPGPVVYAMLNGCILLLDEIDLASTKIMCLQPVLEGKPILLKKTKELIRPAPGFNVFATANTKGKGSYDGRYIGTNVLNEAFLERFSITLEQPYPEKNDELVIIKKFANFIELPSNKKTDTICKSLVDWSSDIRKAFYDDAVNEVISTRRLIHILKAYSITNDITQAITLCITRFDDETKEAFLKTFGMYYVEPSVDDDKLWINVKKDKSSKRLATGELNAPISEIAKF